MHAPPIILDLFLLLALSIVTVLIFRKLDLPAIAGYLLVGVGVGPHAMGWVERTEEVETLAELGVMLLLFSIGLEFSLPLLLRRGRRLLLAGGGQVVLTILVITLGAIAVGLDIRTAIFCGMLVALSSTGFVLKSLHDTRQIDAPHGQLTVEILLFQDLAVVPLMFVVPLLGPGGATGATEVATVLGKALAAIVGVIAFARYGFPRLAALVVRLGGRELFVLFVAMVALGTAWFSASLGLSIALGAFLAGLFISESEYSHQVVSEILPFRDVFNALFFVSIGMLLDPSTILSRPLVIVGLVLAVLFAKAAVVMAVGLFVTRSSVISANSAIALAQIGEFSFLLAQQGEGVGLLGGERSQAFLAVAVSTMFISPFLIRGASLWSARRRGGQAPPGGGSSDGHESDVIIVGYGLNGQNLSRVLKESGIGFQALEMNVDTVRDARARGVPITFGDASRHEVLVHSGIHRAKIVVFAISDPVSTRRGVATARRLAPSVYIIVRTRFMSERQELLNLGADEVIPEEFETSIEIFSRVLRRLHVPRGNIAAQAALIRREGYQLLREDITPERTLEALREVLGESTVDTLYIAADSPVAGRSLGELHIRARTGASIVSVVRSGDAVRDVGPKLVLAPDDILLVVGQHDAIEKCRSLLTGHAFDDDEA